MGIITKQTRSRIEELVFKTMMLLDKTGINANRYKQHLVKLSDEDFSKFMDNVKEKKTWFILEVLPEDEPSLDDIKKAANFLGVPLEEHLFIRHNSEGVIVKTDTPVSVGYLSIKRLQQILSKKNNITLEANKRNVRTGALVNDDKASRVSDVETYALSAMGLNAIKQELLSYRADSMSGKNQMLTQIATAGYATQAEIEVDERSSTTLNTIDVFFLGAGIKSDLVTNTLALRSTEEKISRNIEKKL